jgi:hypothetical protein
MLIPFRGQYTRDEWNRTMRLLSRRSRLKTILWTGAAILFAAIYIYLSLTQLGDGEVSTLDGARMLRHLFTLGLLLYIAFQPLIGAALAANKTWSQPTTHLERSGEIHEQGIEYHAAGQTLNYTWGGFAQVRQSTNLLVLITDGGGMLSFPRAFFQSDADWEQFLSLVKFKVKEAL